MTREGWSNLQPGDYLILSPEGAGKNLPNTAIFRIRGDHLIRTGAYDAWYISKGANFPLMLIFDEDFRRLTSEPTLFLLLYASMSEGGGSK